MRAHILDAIQPDVLLIDDNPGDREMLLYSLKLAGENPNIRIAKDGGEARTLLFGENGQNLQLTRLKLILLDLNIPKISGLEILKRAKSEAATQRVPVVVLTTSDDSSDVETAYRLGANSYHIKPMDFDQFTESVAKIFDYWLHSNVPPPVDRS